MIDGQNLFDQPVKNNLRTYDSIRKIATGQGDNYTTGCLLDYNCFKNYYKMTAIDLTKLQALNVGPKTIQQVSFTGNINRAEGATMFFITEEAKETVLDFSQRTMRVLWMSSYDLANAFSTVYFCFNIISVSNKSI